MMSLVQIISIKSAGFHLGNHRGTATAHSRRRPHLAEAAESPTPVMSTVSVGGAFLVNHIRELAAPDLIPGLTLKLGESGPHRLISRDFAGFSGLLQFRQDPSFSLGALSQPDTGAAAVLVDQFYSCCFQCELQGINCPLF